MTETYNPGAVFAARAELAKTSKVVLTEEFAGRVNALTASLPDGYNLATLFAPWDEDVEYLAKKEGQYYQHPSDEWVNFMESLEHSESVQFRKLVRTAYRNSNCRTLGDIRSLVGRPNLSYGIGPRGRAFGVLAFQKQEPKELTLGL